MSARRFSWWELGGIASVVVMAIAVPAVGTSSEGNGRGHPPPRVVTTGNNSELIKRVAINAGTAAAIAWRCELVWT
jgi:hypothetical protein